MSVLRRTPVSGIPSGFKELQFTTGEITLNYVVGPDHGLSLLLIPGQMESWQGYKCVLPELSTRFQVFVPDLRGHGQSTWTPGRYSYTICGNDLKHFIRDVIQRPAVENPSLDDVISGVSGGCAVPMAAFDRAVVWLQSAQASITRTPRLRYLHFTESHRYATDNPSGVS